MQLRASVAADAETLAHIHRIARLAAVPEWPELHTPEEDRDYFATQILARMTVRMAMTGGAAAGFIAFAENWVHHLYILPEHWRAGIGTRLLAEAKAASPDLQLWTFQSNARARAFYAREGFAEAEFTNGARNEERMPDVRLEWRRAASQG